MTTQTAAPTYAIAARKLALILEDTLRGRTPARIARERVVPEPVVALLQAAHGHPDARALREAVGYLLNLPGDQEVKVAIDAHAALAAQDPEPEAADAREVVTAPEPRARNGARLTTVLTRDLHPDPGNPRETLDDIDELADSIEQVGLLQPVVARRVEDRLVVVAGHRRLAAIKQLGWDSTQVIIRSDLRPDDVLAAMLIENTQRTDLDPVEEARALRRIKTQMGEASDTAIAARLGRTPLFVGSRLAILALPPEEQELLRAGDMNIGDAIRRGRMASGRVRARNSTGHPHLGIDHPLERLARARCSRLAHKKRGRNSVGGVACGECWESVIRADERDSLHAHAAKGTCPICDAPTSLEA